MVNLFRLYSNILHKHPLRTKVVTSVTIVTSADLIR